MTTTIDPLAGIPIGTAKPARKPKGALVIPTVVPGSTVINLAQAKSKRHKLTGEAYKQARDFARGATGYNDTSPIWGKRLNVVLTEIETKLNYVSEALNDGRYIDATDDLEQALLWNKELQKRIATGQLIAAQS